MKPLHELKADELDQFKELVAGCYSGLLSKSGITASPAEAVNQARQLWDAIEAELERSNAEKKAGQAADKAEKAEHRAELAAEKAESKAGLAEQKAAEKAVKKK